MINLELKYSDKTKNKTYLNVSEYFALIYAQSHLLECADNYAIIDNGRHVQLLTRPIDFKSI